MKQGKAARVANSVYDENAMAGCIEDVRDALTDYQVNTFTLRSRSHLISSGLSPTTSFPARKRDFGAYIHLFENA